MPQAPEPRKHFIIPDCQVRPGVPLDHIDWIAKAIVDYKPDVVVCLGDFWDLASLNGHAEKGSMQLEGTRYKDDIRVGNEAFARLSAPMDERIAWRIRTKRKVWRPRKVYLKGNHEIRADRTINNDPKYQGVLSSDDCLTPGWERYGFLERVNIDGIVYSHYFQNTHSNYPIGGEVPTRLSKIGSSFVQGHEQGKREGNKIMGDGRTIYGLVVGSCYLHLEDYRGAQGQRHWRGVAVLNEVENGEYDRMDLSLKYLCRKYTGAPSLYDYMVRQYPFGDWNHLK